MSLITGFAKKEITTVRYGTSQHEKLSAWAVLKHKADGIIQVLAQAKH